MSTLQRIYWSLWVGIGLLVGATAGWVISGLLGAALGAIAGGIIGTLVAALGADAIILLLGLFSR
jgi:hypothetical protein